MVASSDVESRLRMKRSEYNVKTEQLRLLLTGPKARPLLALLQTQVRTRADSCRSLGDTYLTSLLIFPGAAGRRPAQEPLRGGIEGARGAGGHRTAGPPRAGEAAQFFAVSHQAVKRIFYALALFGARSLRTEQSSQQPWCLVASP